MVSSSGCAAILLSKNCNLNLLTIYFNITFNRITVYGVSRLVEQGLKYQMIMPFFYVNTCEIGRFRTSIEKVVKIMDLHYFTLLHMNGTVQNIAKEIKDFYTSAAILLKLCSHRQMFTWGSHACSLCGHANPILFYSILFYSILFYSILFYSILFYSILFYSILFYSVLFCSVLFCSVLFYSILFHKAITASSITGVWGVFGMLRGEQGREIVLLAHSAFGSHSGFCKRHIHSEETRSDFEAAADSCCCSTCLHATTTASQSSR